MKTIYAVKLTKDEALKLGIVHCKNCGYPPNNHFMDQLKKLCAHDKSCTGYVERFSMGAPIKP